MKLKLGLGYYIVVVLALATTITLGVVTCSCPECPESEAPTAPPAVESVPEAKVEEKSPLTEAPICPSGITRQMDDTIWCFAYSEDPTSQETLIYQVPCDDGIEEFIVDLRLPLATYLGVEGRWTEQGWNPTVAFFTIERSPADQPDLREVRPLELWVNTACYAGG